MLEKVFVERWPWWAGGIGIGLLVPLLYLLTNTALGVSTGYAELIRWLFPQIKLRWFHSSAFAGSPRWRLWFMAGMLLGAAIAARLAGYNWWTAEMGILTSSGLSTGTIMLLLFSGGVLLGLGARIAGGCTSGHSIHGLANFHKSSLVATVAFLLAGWFAFWLIRTMLMGAGVQ